MNPLHVDRPTVQVWRGNVLPPKDRHTSAYPSPGVDLGGVKWIAACDLCDWATSRDNDEQGHVDILEVRRPHLLRAHGPELQSGAATVNLTRRGIVA